MGAQRKISPSSPLQEKKNEERVQEYSSSADLSSPPLQIVAFLKMAMPSCWNDDRLLNCKPIEVAFHEWNTLWKAYDGIGLDEKEFGLGRMTFEGVMKKFPVVVRPHLTHLLCLFWG